MWLLGYLFGVGESPVHGKYLQAKSFLGVACMLSGMGWREGRGRGRGEGKEKDGLMMDLNPSQHYFDL